MSVEGIVVSGVTKILKKLSSDVQNKITLAWDFKDELKNLQSTLNMILDVMEDAEKKQLNSMAVRRWMEELKSIAYDAEDILDEYSYEVILWKREKEEQDNSTFLNKVCNLCSSSIASFVCSWKLAQQIKENNERFKIIENRKNALDLLKLAVGSSSSQHELMMKNRETHSLAVTEWKVVGRENDKSNIINMLLDEEENSTNNQGDDGGKNVSVVAIVGMGGVGKTTMAQQVYNDEVVQKHFELKVWICVSDPFDITKLWEKIANLIGIPIGDLACWLQNAFKRKKFILVLDDVWNENPTLWYKFKKPFVVGREGSKILVTTRNENVAVIMVDKFQPYRLGILNDSDSWYLFKEISFGSIAGAEETSNLVKIGEEIVKRCRGLPLAVIFLGSLMRFKKKEEEWESIKNTKLWHESGKNSEILPSLRLSYDNLPLELKLCFSYCCLFPKDLIIRREKLIRLWMAEGFLIESPKENAMSMEEIGNEYFHTLLSNFFFQDAEKDIDGDIETCKMHDLVHDLARSVIGKNECLIVENAHDIDCISKETRRLNLLIDFYDKEMLAKVLVAVKKAKNLRTILVESQRNLRTKVVESERGGMNFYIDIGDAFKENKRLRVLDLSRSRWCRVTKSISSIGSLKHLRYLVARGARFSKGMIGQLGFLQTWLKFKVGDKKNKNASGIEELEGLNLLSGDFSIYDLENVTNEIDARRANLKEKKNLRRLHLSWDSERANPHHGEAVANNDEAVLEELRPHPNLRTLEIDGYYGSKFPRWIEDSSCLPNLVELTLKDCYYCEQVAGFGALPSLRSLTLAEMHNLECIGNEFYYSAAAVSSTTTTIPFPSLKKLKLLYTHSLEEWFVPAVPSLSTTGATANCFPLLEEITIEDCIFIFITPTTITFPSLKVLFLSNIEVMEVETLVTNNLNSLTLLLLEQQQKHSHH